MLKPLGMLHTSTHSSSRPALPSRRKWQPGRKFKMLASVYTSCNWRREIAVFKPKMCRMLPSHRILRGTDHSQAPSLLHCHRMYSDSSYTAFLRPAVGCCVLVRKFHCGSDVNSIMQAWMSCRLLKSDPFHLDSAFAKCYKNNDK